MESGLGVGEFCGTSICGVMKGSSIPLCSPLTNTGLTASQWVRDVRKGRTEEPPKIGAVIWGTYCT